MSNSQEDYSRLGNVDPDFWKDKHVFLTGHTGFKGGWLSLWLKSMGAKVTGYALAPNTNPSFYDVVDVQSFLEKSHIADIRDLITLKLMMLQAMPDVLIHMAAQPLVRYSYANPVETFAINVMGTVNVLEAARTIESIKAIVVVTTDKCYENQEQSRGYRENDPLGGSDPYSGSKACSELAIESYRKSFFSGSATKSSAALGSARAGNVIGGGDWAADRLIPDALTKFESNSLLMLRNPLATRPWQHVLEPLSGYLILAQALFENGKPFASAWNFGPSDESNKTVAELINILGDALGIKASWQQDLSTQPRETHLLKLDCSKAQNLLRWAPKWKLDQSIEKIVQWQQAFNSKKDMKAISLEQINDYLTG